MYLPKQFEVAALRAVGDPMAELVEQARPRSQPPRT